MQRFAHLATVFFFVAVLFGFGLSFWLIPDATFSAEENRSLQPPPTLSSDRFFSGRYSSEMNDYYADQFPLRDTLVGWKGVAEIALGKGENNGVLLGANGQLAKRNFDILRADGSVSERTDGFDPERIASAMDGIARAAESLREAGIPFSVLLTGRTVDVAASTFSYPTDRSDALLSAIRAGETDLADWIGTVPMFRERFDRGEAVYYRTDHHWTTLGAYYAYCEILSHFGMEEEILPADAFVRETVTDSFYGTTWSAAGMKFVEPEPIELWKYGNEDAFTVTADGQTTDGFYSTRYLDEKDKYSVFLDGTHTVVTVQKEGETRPLLLLFKDSFANSLAPFLAQHFDLVLLNLSSRADFSDFAGIASQYGADRVLLVYTIANLLTANKLAALR